MKLKPIVALTMFGLAGGSVMAASAYDDGDYSSRLDRLEALIGQNQSGIQADNTGWTDRIAISGDLRVNLTHGTANKAYDQNSKSNDINLADANFYIDARANDWATGHVSVKFQQNGVFGEARDRNRSVTRNTDETFYVDEAYMALSNFAESNWYARVGRQYVDFGMYERNVITQSLTQMLTQTRQTAITVGHADLLGHFNIHGVHASAGVYRDFVRETNDDQTGAQSLRELIRGGVASLGYQRNIEGYDLAVGGSYIHNLWHTDAMHFSRANGLTYNEDSQRVGALAAYVNLGRGPWDIAIRYAGAVNSFDTNALATDGDDNNQASPYAVAVTGGYNFDSWGGYPSRLAVSYQASDDAASYGAHNNASPTVRGLPKQRWQADYNIELWENTDLGFQYVLDTDYGTNQTNGTYTASGRNNTILTASLRFRFA